MMIVAGTSCLDENFDQISLDDSGPWDPVVALPIGNGRLDVNDYFSDYILPDSIPGDTIRVSFDGEDYLLADQKIEADYSFSYSLYHYLDSPDLIRYARFFLRVENHYPTACQVQIYVEDAPGQAVDSIFDAPPIAEPAKTDDEGQVTGPSSQLFSADLDSTDVQTLFDNSRITTVGSVVLQDESREMISIYSGQYIQFTVFMEVALRLNEEDLER
jgi:hypothetical protein